MSERTKIPGFVHGDLPRFVERSDGREGLGILTKPTDGLFDVSERATSVAEDVIALGAHAASTLASHGAASEPVVYLPPLWIHNGAIIRTKWGGTEYVLCRLQLGSTREASSVCMARRDSLPEDGLLLHRGERCEPYFRVPVARVEKYGEPTGRVMSILNRPL